MDIQSRVVNYYKNNQFIQKYLKGIDSKTNELVLSYNNEDRRLSIDSLESIKTENDLISLLNGNPVNQPVMQSAVTNSAIAPEVTPEVSIPSVQEPEPVVPAPIVPEPQEQIMLTERDDLSRESLNDIKILVELKNKDGLNNVLKSFAVNPSTGLIDINQALSTVTKNTMNEVIKALQNNYVFSDDLTKYNVDGTYIGTPTLGEIHEDEQIVKSFNNVKLLIEASKMYPEQVNYNDEQIGTFMQSYIQNVKNELHGAPAAPQEPAPAPVVEASGNAAPASASAGFADIFVLTVIVLVYAVIIVNLILRLK